LTQQHSPFRARLVKAGLLPERYARPLSRVSNYGELAGYCGSITLTLLRIRLLVEGEARLLTELQRRHKVEQRLRGA
jgi:hypothetical protein